MIELEYSTDEQLQQDHAEVLKIMHNLRFWTKYWHIHYGHKAKAAKQYWEKRADELLDSKGLTEHNNTRAIKICKNCD